MRELYEKLYETPAQPYCRNGLGTRLGDNKYEREGDNKYEVSGMKKPAFAG
jgi:hypothetical protein